MNHWVRIYRLALLVLVIVATAVAVLVFMPRFNRLDRMRKTRDGMELECRATEAAIAEIQEKQKKFASEPDFVEYTARKQGLVRPDETVFKFTNTDARAITENW